MKCSVMLISLSITHHNKTFINFPCCGWSPEQPALKMLGFFYAYVCHMKKVIICELNLFLDNKSYAI